MPEGIEGRVAYKGPLSQPRLPARRRSALGMGYCRRGEHRALKHDARFVRITAAGLRESHPHDIVITREAPNYGSSGF